MLGMDRAIHRTLEAIHNRDSVLVFGDSDVDGITAASCVYQFLSRLGVTVAYQIPSRTDEGYGLTLSEVRAAHAAGHNLIITTDCGIGNFDSVALAATLGVDVIIVDHHTLPPKLPQAKAILNPLQPGCRFPFKKPGRRGRGLQLRLRAQPGAQGTWRISRRGALDDRLHGHRGPWHGGRRRPSDRREPHLRRLGLKVLRRRHRPGIQALMERAQVDNHPITARTIGYRWPRLLNAAGRMGDASRCVELLTTRSYGRAIELAKELERDNTRRQQAERAILTEATVMAEAAFDKGRSLIMLSGEGWHAGVLGIVASRIKESFHRPSALVAINPTTRMARVSLRAIPGVDLIAALTTVSDKLASFGGHIAAAGMTLHADDLEEVSEALDLAIKAQLESPPVPVVSLDTSASLAEMDHLFARELTDLAPFGVSHPEPMVLVQDVRCVRKRIVGERHLRVQIRENGVVCDAIGFALAERVDVLGFAMDMAITPRAPSTLADRAWSFISRTCASTAARTSAPGRSTMARKRVRRTGRRMRGPGTAEITTVILLVCMLLFILAFKDTMATNLSSVLGAFSGSSAPELASPAGEADPPQRRDP